MKDRAMIETLKLIEKFRKDLHSDFERLRHQDQNDDKLVQYMGVNYSRIQHELYNATIVLKGDEK